MIPYLMMLAEGAAVAFILAVLVDRLAEARKPPPPKIFPE